MKSSCLLIILSLIGLFAVTSCKKYLEKKPNSKVLTPNTPAEFQGLLDNPDVFSYGHTLGLLSTDEIYFSPAYYDDKLTTWERNAYIWDPKIFGPAEIPFDWSKAYEQIFNTNITLEGLIPLMSNTTEDRDLNKVRGDALFKRSLAHFQLAQLFAPAYEDASADADMGIPLKLKTDAEEPVVRPNLRVCYNQILSDLNDATALLPARPDPAHLNRASKASAQALLARVHLYMGHWQASAIAAGNALTAYDSLMDYNAIDTTVKPLLKADNLEIVYLLKAPDMTDQNNLVVGLASEGANVDTQLIHLYVPHDLRLSIFFRQRNDKTWGIRYTLTGTRIPFEGIAVSEIYLTLAEAQARQGNTSAALACLNKLLIKRYTTGQIPTLPDSTDKQAVLERILFERRLELPLRGLRWLDLKRLNKQNRNITVARVVNTKPYSLKPNDLRYALPLPVTTVEKYELKQNAR